MREHVIATRVDEDLKNRIDEQATAEHRSVANFIIHAILFYLDSLNKSK